MVEFLLSIAVLVVLVGLATPSYTTMIKRRQVNGEADKLWAAIYLAKSEAVKRNTKVTLCKSGDQATCSGSWSDGWILFSDKNGNRIVDGSDRIIDRSIALVGDYRLTWKAFISNNYLNFDPSGLTNQNGTFKFCPENNDARFAKALIVSKLARVREKKGSISCP
ncbi:MAG: GspH/FimT family pseudopilin [Gammaproteobacteria bacterium]